MEAIAFYNNRKRRVREMEKYQCVLVGKNRDEKDSDIKRLMRVLSRLWDGKLAEEWCTNDATNMLYKIINLQTFPAEFMVFIERGYVDRVYRDIYYHHYASRHFSQPRNCLRLFFFKGTDQMSLLASENMQELLIGVSVIQPNGIVGRSYWNPKYFLEPGSYVRTADFTATILGRKLHIKAFPYTMQDREATTCAEVTVLNLIDYYSQSYPEYHSILLSDIEIVEARHSAERIFPSHGMNYADVARSLTQVGLSPRIYDARCSKLTKRTVNRYIYYYVESGIPFGIAVESSEHGVLHSMVCIGHGSRNRKMDENLAVNYLTKEETSDHKVKIQNCWIFNSADLYNTFIVMDDNARPYQTVGLKSATNQWTFPDAKKEPTEEVKGKTREITEYAVRQLCVPFYKRVFLEVDGAAEVFVSVLTSRIGFHQTMCRKDCCTEYTKVGETKENPLIIRMFLASSRTFLSYRMQTLDTMDINKMDDKIIEVYQNLYCPRFVWVCELYTQKTFVSDEPSAIGEIVVDATSRCTDNMGALVLLHYPHYITYRDTDSNWIDLEYNEQWAENWVPFKQFQGNLHDFSK